MSRTMSHEEIREDYIRRAEERNPGKGREIGESYLFLEGKLLFMKHRFSEYKKVMRGDKVDRMILHHYLQGFLRDACNAFLDGVILEIVNFIDERGDAKRGHLSLYSFNTYVNGEELKEKIRAIEDKANPIVQRRHASVAHWGKAAISQRRAIPISIDEIDRVIAMIAGAMDYIGETLLGLNRVTVISGNYDPRELIVSGGVEHVIAYLKHYEWLFHKQKEYAMGNEPFFSPRWASIFDSTEQGEDERRKQKGRILALTDT